MKGSLPFSLTKRKESDYYYVRFKDSNGKYLSWKSTKETDYNLAVKKSWEMYYKSQNEIETSSIRNSIKLSDITSEDATAIVNELIKKGLVKSCVIANSKCDINAFDYFMDFWDKDKSEYLKEKKRKDKTVHKKHILQNQSYLNNYWTEILEGKTLGSLSRSDIKLMFDKLDNLNRSGNTKNHILRAVLTPMKYAYNQEIVDFDLSQGWVFYQSKSKKRKILTKEVAAALFSREWKNKMAMVASMVSMCTGMRAGEILALTLKDIGEDCIYVNNSWSDVDKYKGTKTEEQRIEYIYYKSIIYRLLELGNTNPYTTGTKYIFYATIPDKPIDEKVFLKSLRYELGLLGFTESEQKEITFHSWRHFYATYMKDKVPDKVLQSQTGHKTIEMLEHYSNHSTLEDIEKIKNAQEEVFRGIIS